LNENFEMVEMPATTRLSVNESNTVDSNAIIAKTTETSTTNGHNSFVSVAQSRAEFFTQKSVSGRSTPIAPLISEIRTQSPLLFEDVPNHSEVTMSRGDVISNQPFKISNTLNARHETVEKSKGQDEASATIDNKALPDDTRVTSPTINLVRKTSIPKLTPRYVSNSRAQKVTSPIRSPISERPSFIPRMVNSKSTSPTRVGFTNSSNQTYQHCNSSTGNNFVSVNNETERVRIFVPYGTQRLDGEEDANKLKLRVTLSEIEYENDRHGVVLPAVDT